MRIAFFLLICTSLFAAPKPIRDATHLPEQERIFAERLSLAKRKVFCGMFNEEQREMAMQYAFELGKESHLSPDEAVTKVMEEFCLPMAVKSRRQCEVQ